MSPSAAPPAGEASRGDNDMAKIPVTVPKDTETAPSMKQTNSKKEKGKADAATQPTSNGAENAFDSKLTGKEAKMKAKAEKAARRMQEKEKKQGQPSVEPPTGNQGGAKNKPGRRDSLSASSAGASRGSQHKRTGSTGAQSLPIRAAEVQSKTTPLEPKREDKKVALFDHLYGHPRRVTLAGAAKDVHPTVLALGLQMSSYVICGSNARCVAMLLAFKEVS